MLSYAFYAIRAKPEIVNSPDIDDDFAELLLDDPVIYRNREGGRSEWLFKDHETFLKLLFVADHKADYHHPFFSNATVSVGFFDQWWTITRYHGVDDVEAIIDNLDPKVLDQFENTGIGHVDEAFRRACRRED